MRFEPGHAVNVQDPEVSQPAPAHAAVDDELGRGAVLVGHSDGRVGLSGRRAAPVSGRDLPLERVVGLELKGVQVVQIPERKSPHKYMKFWEIFKQFILWKQITLSSEKPF